MATATQPLVGNALPAYAVALDPEKIHPGVDLLLSKMDRFRLLERAERERRLALLTDEEKLTLAYNWNLWARPNQLMPPDVDPATGQPWVTWLVQAGRGYGKTRTGVETTRQWIRSEKEPIITHVVAPTNADLNKVILDGPAGFLTCCDPREIIDVVRGNINTIKWAGGSKTLLFSAEEPERLRGPQCHKLWADEIAAWKYPDRAWDNAMFGLRLGTSPRAVVTSTPKPIPLIKRLLKEATTLVTRGTTYENKHNLAPAFLAQVLSKYQNTRLGRQEIFGEVLEDNPGALWNQALIEKLRVETFDHTKFRRIVVAIDPSASSNNESDECGIVAAGEGPETPSHYYAIEDRSQVAHPNVWARTAVNLYHQLKADCIVAEKNNGGEMVEAVIHHVDPNVPVRLVHASRGKITRAEPVAALYEQGRCHHIGMLAVLEDQMCDYNPSTATESPDRMDALVWAVTELSARSFGLFEVWRQEYEKQQAGTSTATPAQPVDVARQARELAEEQKRQTSNEPWVNVVGRSNKAVTPAATAIVCDKCGNKSVAVYSERWQCVCGASGLRPGVKL